MASKTKLLFAILLIFSSTVESATFIEKSYEYVLSLGKSLAPSLMTFVDCLGEDDVWKCAKERAGKLLDNWDSEVDEQRRMWQEAADAEVSASGRSIEELPSRIGREVENSLISVADLIQQGMARALSRKHHESGGGIDSITISTGTGEKKKMKKKKIKPPKIHLHQPMMMAMQDQDRGFKKVQSWVIGDEALKDLNASGMDSSEFPDPSAEVEDSSKDSTGVDLKNASMDRNFRKGRGIVSDMWAIGEKAIDAVAEHALDSDNSEDGIEDKSSVEETRGKKKKKKKAILKLLILGAVLKAKIGTLLQILSFKLQVKFFLIALVGLGINLARFWIDLKKQHAPPQKVIYYEHAQHQHHYDHEEEPGWGPWSRSMEPEQETDAEIDLDVNNPYRAQIDRNAQVYSRPHLTRV